MEWEMRVFTRYYYLSCRLKILVCHSLRWLSFLSMVVLGRESFAKFVIGESGGGRRVRNCIRVLLVPSPDPTPNAGTPDSSGRSREWKVDPRKSPSRPVVDHLPRLRLGSNTRGPFRANNQDLCVRTCLQSK